VEWIGLAPARGAKRVAVREARAEVGTGLAGDWHAKEKPGGGRQVTFVGAEDLEAVGALLGRPVPPAQSLRNVMLRGIDLQRLQGRRFRIGEASFEGVGDCAPCTHMADGIGPGALEAFARRGGLCARVLEAGAIRVGDLVLLEPGDVRG
jgi:MOSC domain-containing protein YiiM